MKKIKRGDRLQTFILELSVEESLEVPYRFYSEGSIRSLISQLHLKYPQLRYTVNSKLDTLAVVTRVS